MKPLPAAHGISTMGCGQPSVTMHMINGLQGEDGRVVTFADFYKLLQPVNESTTDFRRYL